MLSLQTIPKSFVIAFRTHFFTRWEHEELVNQEIRVGIELFSYANRTLFFFSQFCVASDHVSENDLNILQFKFECFQCFDLNVFKLVVPQSHNLRRSGFKTHEFSLT